MRNVLGWIPILFCAAGAVSAQSGPSRAYDPPPKDYRSPQRGGDPTPDRADYDAAAYDWSDPTHELELYLNDDAVWVGFQTPLRRGEGHLLLGGFAGEDEDYLITAKLMRFGRPIQDDRFRLGVGLGAYAAWLDDPDHENVYALTLSGSARYAFSTDVPTFFGFEGSFAPDVTTWDDGERLIDLMARFEAEISSFATGFIGYRFLEIELEDSGDERELDDQFHVGVRLGF